MCRTRGLTCSVGPRLTVAGRRSVPYIVNYGRPVTLHYLVPNGRKAYETEAVQVCSAHVALGIRRCT